MMDLYKEKEIGGDILASGANNLLVVVIVS